MTQDNQTTELSDEDVRLYKEWGLTASLALSDAGDALLTFYGEEARGTWQVKSPTSAEASFVVTDENVKQRENYPIALKDGQLTLTVGDLSLVFKKMIPKTDSSEQAAQANQSEQAAQVSQTEQAEQATQDEQDGQAEQATQDE